MFPRIWRARSLGTYIGFITLGTYILLYHSKLDEPTLSTAQIPDLESPGPDHGQSNVLHRTGQLLFDLKEESGQTSNQNMSCHIPVLDPFNNEFTSLVLSTESRIELITRCTGEMQFYNDYNSHLIKVHGNEDYFNKLTCCYFTFTRGKDDMMIDKREKYCYPITEYVTVIPPEHEFIVVKCTRKDSQEVKYTDCFGFVHLKPDVEARAAAVTAKDNPDPLSIIILGFDSVSQMNYQRFMSETREYMVKELSAIEFMGRNKVHESTLANIVPILTGWTPDELTNTVKCWPNPPNSHFDKCPFIWKEFENRRYRTVYGEDQIKFSIFLDSTLIGFEKPIADYDFRTLLRGMELMGQYDFCFTHQNAPQLLLDSVASAAVTFRDKPYFQFTWITSFVHNAVKATKFVDKPVLNLLQMLREQNLLNNTIFILVSDHGMNYGGYVQHKQGMLESRMPMLNIVLPEWFHKKYSRAVRNLKINTQRLSTPFDLHEMLTDLLDTPNSISNSALSRREETSYSSNRGISLFLPIPLNRSCEEAGIDDHWCICLSKTPIENPEKSPNVVKAVNFSLDTINFKIFHFPICAKLELDKIVLARSVNPEANHVSGRKKFMRYEVLFQVKPSKGIFQATVLFTKMGKLTMGGPISRIDAYKNQGDCIDQTTNGTLEVKSMCFCV